MSAPWYKKCLPRVSEVRETLHDLTTTLRQFDGVKTIYLFGSLAENYSNPNKHIKDVDIIVTTPFYSEDLIAITEDTLSTKSAYLEEEGFDIKAVSFSKGFVRLAYQYPLDKWVLSKDKKLLHWGPFLNTKEESDEVKIEAETFATQKTGFNLSKISKISEERKNMWYDSFKSYLQKQYEDMPSGWYVSQENSKDILQNCIKLS